MSLKRYLCSSALAVATAVSLVGCKAPHRERQEADWTVWWSGREKKAEAVTQAPPAPVAPVEVKPAPRPAPPVARPAEPAARPAQPPVRPAEPVARPAPAPAPAPAGMSSGRLYIPTGDAATSVLLVEKFQPGEVTAGKPFDYEIRVTNISKNKLEAIEVTDTISNNLKVADSPLASFRDGAATINVGMMNPGETKSYKMTATATGGDSIRNCVSATYATTLCLVSPVVAPALKVVKTVPAEVMVCDVVPVRIVVTNTGTGVARGVRVDDALPAGMTVDGKTNLSFDVGALAAGQSREITFNARVAKTGKYDNKATAKAEGDMSAESTVVSTVARQPVLDITVKCPPEKLRAGQTATHEITVTNEGDGVAADTTLRMPLVQGLTFASATEGGAVSGPDVLWRLGNLAPGQSKTVAVAARTGGTGVIKTSFAAIAKCADQVTGNCAFEVVGVPDIGTSIDDFDGVVAVGANHNFQFVAVNQGQVDLTNVTVEFTPDQGLEFVSTDAAGGAAAAGGKQTVKLGTLKVGETRKFNIVYKGTTEGDKILQSVTASDQTRAVRNDEQVNFVK